MTDSKIYSNAAEITADQIELLSYLLEEEGLDLPGIETVSVKRRPDELPLSFAQQRLWFLDQLEPGSSAYSIPTAVRLTGLLDVAALQQTFNEIVRRHEVLRTTFSMGDGRAVQVIAAAQPVSLEEVDLTDFPDAERQIAASQWIAQKAAWPFDLSRGPLLRVTLLKLSESEHVLLVTMHHIVSDGWSMGVLVNEVATLYAAYQSGGESPLPELPIQYADYAVWQRERLQGEILEQELSYWREQLAGAPVLELPPDRPRPAVQSYRGASESFELGAELSEQLRALSRREGVTLFMSLLAVFQVLLSRYSGQEEVVVGSPIANRTRGETEPLVGFFVNTLALRTDLSGNPSFSELLGRVREVCLGAYAHQELPFDRLVDELQPERDMSRTPLFQVLLVLQNAPTSTFELPELALRPVNTKNEISKFDLTLTLTEEENGLRGTLEFRTDLFDASTIARMGQHFTTLLNNIIADPDQLIMSISLLSEAERQQQLVQWNDTAVEYTGAQCIHQLFEAQAARTPERIAVIFNEEQLSYRELNARANQLAHYLRQLGIGPEVRVGLCVERSPEMVVGMLGILKSGGAYVPMDPEYPLERLSFMMEDAGLEVVLTQRRLLDTISRPGVSAFCLDSDWSQLAQQSQTNPHTETTAANLSHVLYTSGSTGKPKGVMITHAAMCNHMRWMQIAFGFSETDRVLQKTQFSFDASVWEFYTPLLVGARLIMAEPGGHQESAYLVRVIREQQISTIQLVPSLLRALLEDPGFAACDSLSRVFVGGEVLTSDLTERFFTQLAARLYNLYGPTETCIEVTSWLCTSADSEGIVPIGRPIANIQLFVLDQVLQPVPVNVTGELFISGAGVARGYLGRPDLTAERFLPHPYATTAGERLYRTGDLARYNADGSIEVLGRIDRQVKVGGFRIELGEIEAVLVQHPLLHEAVVLAPSDANRLVAYLTAAHATDLPSDSELRRHLAARVPSYMIPTRFVWLPQMPLTPNGKVDRSALAAAADEYQPSMVREFVAPGTPAEQTLIRIWQEVLRVEQVGLHDNFFELGGDSVLGVQVISKAYREGLRLTLKHLFLYQTVAGLAAVAEVIDTPTVHDQGTVSGELPLTTIQRWFVEQEMVEPDHYNQAVMFEVRMRLDEVALKRAVRALLKHHDALRLRCLSEAGEWRQRIVEREETEVVSRIDLSSAKADELEKRLETTTDELQRSLRLSEGPLVQVAIIELGETSGERLWIGIHHMAVDGVSWRILLEDLEKAYEQAQRDEPVELGPKTTSYKEWAERLKAYAQSPAIDEEQSFWLAQSRRQAPLLPRDNPRGENTKVSERSAVAWLDSEDTRALLQEVPAVYHTEINDVLLTALVQVCSQWNGRRRLLLEMEGHGREAIIEGVDVSRTVGWFTTMYPVLLDIEKVEGIGNQLKTVKEQLRKVPQHGIGYGLLRYLRGGEVSEQLAKLPQPEVIFNYLGQFDQTFAASSHFVPAQESSGAAQSPLAARTHLLEVTGLVLGGRFQIQLRYSEDIYNAKTIERLADAYIAALQEIVAHCCTPKAGGFTPSDFPRAKVSQEELDKLMNRDFATKSRR